MAKFHASPSPYRIRKENNLFYVENDYTCWCHDLSRGGELCEAIVKYGSGENLLPVPQKISLGILENWGYHHYDSLQLPADNFEFQEKDQQCTLKYSHRLADKQNNVLDGISVQHQVRYTPWGCGQHHVRIQTHKPISSLGELQIGSFYASRDFDCCSVRPSLVESGYPIASNMVQGWLPLSGGHRRSDVPVYMSRWLPVSILLLRRGLEALEFSLGDELSAWDDIGCPFPGWQKTYICYDQKRQSYEVRICPLDSPRENQPMSGSYEFRYRMSLPHVKPKLLPLRPGAGGIFYSDRGFAERWPSAGDIASWQQSGVTLMRLHNDGDSLDNGTFWRDAAYPPYPPEEMNKMTVFLQQAAAAGIAVVPYFSVKEFHPEAADYLEKSDEWARLTAVGEQALTNHYEHGVFGTQMCLKSQWHKKRRDTIAEVLQKHVFQGVYFDWCTGLECHNPAHSSGRHWDNDELLELLIWSYQQAGPQGEVYLHLTNTPCLAAENLASLVLTEESGYGELSPFMFTPHVHFANVVPRQICDMLGAKATAAERRKLALCALLHHASISSHHPDYLQFYREAPAVDYSQYQRHSAPGEGVTHSSKDAIGISAYWNKQQLRLVFVNTSETCAEADWQFTSHEKTSPELPENYLQGKICLQGLEMKSLLLQVPD